ncbi:MAG: hypothetical protein WAT09_11825 [Paracoccaceae bacterium]
MRALAILSAIAMVVSLFLSWLNPRMFGMDLVPWTYLKQADLSVESLRKLAESSPPEALVFVATFVLAALFAVLAILGLASRVLALLTGGGAVGLMAYGAFQLQAQIKAGGLPLPGANDLMQAVQKAPEFLGPGAFAWAAGAVVLLLTGLIGFGERR